MFFALCKVTIILSCTYLNAYVMFYSCFIANSSCLRNLSDLCTWDLVTNIMAFIVMTPLVNGYGFQGMWHLWNTFHSLAHPLLVLHVYGNL